MDIFKFTASKLALLLDRDHILADMRAQEDLVQNQFYQISMGMARRKGGKTTQKDKIFEIANTIWEILVKEQYIVCLEATSSRKTPL